MWISINGYDAVNSKIMLYGENSGSETDILLNNGGISIYIN